LRFGFFERSITYLEHRFYIPPENWNPDSLTLSGSEAHHCRDVLRMTRGDRAVLFNGRGREITAEIVDVHAGQVRLRKLHESQTPPLRCHITLGQAIPKGKNMELIVQKAVEIGASEIAPIISERTIVDLDGKEATQRKLKWQTVAIEAAKQCGQNWLPHVHQPRRLKEFFASAEADVSPAQPVASQSTRLPLEKNDWRYDLQLIGSLQPDALHLKEILADFSSEHRYLPSSVLMLIGPEGDFTPAELALARSHGCRPITLGPIILRVETAAIYCLSILSYELLV
jgi:16S rRNA (uracil1498-N3)-methyltransferase